MPKFDLTSAHRVKSNTTDFDKIKGTVGQLWSRHPLEQHYGDGPDKIHFHLCHRTVNKSGQFQPTRNFAPLAVNMTHTKGIANVENNLISFTNSPSTEIQLDNHLELVGCHIVFVVDLSNITSSMGFFGRWDYPVSGIRVGAVQTSDTVFLAFIQRQVSGGTIANIQPTPRFPISRTGLSIIHAVITPTSINSWVHDLQKDTVSSASTSSGYDSFLVSTIGNGQNIGAFNGQIGEVIVMKQGDNSQSIVDDEVIPYLKSVYAP